MGAGFETTASLINGALYLLLRNPDSLKKLTDEVRSAFATPADIKLAELDKLPYLIACLQEALRWYPPAAAAAQRQVMKGGATIAGRFVPEDVSNRLKGTTSTILVQFADFAVYRCCATLGCVPLAIPLHQGRRVSP